MRPQGDPTSAKANSWRSLGGRRGERDFAEMLSDGFRSAGKHLVKAPGLSTGTLVVRKGHAEAFNSVGSWGSVPFLLVAPCLCQLLVSKSFLLLLACLSCSSLAHMPSVSDMKKQMKKLVGIPAMRVHLAAVNSHRMARGVYAVLGMPVA